MKKAVSLLLAILMSFTFCACGSAPQSSQEKDFEESQNLVVGEETIIGFYDILTEVGIDKNDISEVTKIDDWRLGPRYSFNLNGTPLQLYCNMDGTIYSLGLGNTNLYEQGYETWTIDNFLIDPDAKSAAIDRTKDLVKACLNYPASADFPWLDWSVGRSFNWYSVSSTVTAKNAFGVESEIPFVAIFWVEGNSIKPIYLEVNGEIVRDDREDYPLPDRKVVEVEIKPSEEGTIHIVDGQLGDYGKKVKLDSYEYDWYMVPAGKYEAASNVKTCTVYVDKDEITRNSSGYVEMQNVATYTWNYGETIEIEVGEGEHLFNVYGADYVLTPIS